MSSSNAEKQECRVFVGQIPEGVTESEIREVFEKFGELVGVDYMTKGNKPSYAFVQFRRKEDVEEVLGTKERIQLGSHDVKVGRANPSTKNENRNRKEWRNDSSAWRSDSPPARNRDASASPPRRSSFYEPAVRNERHRRSRSRSPKAAEREFRVNVENLPGDMTWQELKRLGADYGKSITFARTSRGRDGDMIGLVAFTERRDAEKFVESLDGKKMEGADRRLRVDMEIPRDTRTRRVSPEIRRPRADNHRY